MIALIIILLPNLPIGIIDDINKLIHSNQVFSSVYRKSEGTFHKCSWTILRYRPLILIVYPVKLSSLLPYKNKQLNNVLLFRVRESYLWFSLL